MNVAFILFFLQALLSHSLLSLTDECHQSLHFGFRLLQKPLNFLSGIVFFQELPNIEFIEPTIQDLEAGIAFLARTAIGKAQAMAQQPAVAILVVKINIWHLHNCFA